MFERSCLKVALTFQTLVGRGKKINRNCRTRGDMNILIMGLPGTAKSQLCRAATLITPIIKTSSGRGSTRIGLTVAVMKGLEERFIDAGLLVLANRGIIVIDEFDKIFDIDRIILQESFEQQTVTIVKASFSIALKVKCSVLVAFNLFKGIVLNGKLKENINFSDFLFSRFDLLFFIREENSENQDYITARQILLIKNSLSKFDKMKLLIKNVCYNELFKVLEDIQLNILTLEFELGLFTDSELSAKNISPVILHSILQILRIKIINYFLKSTSKADIPLERFYVSLRRNKLNNTEISTTIRALDTLLRLASASSKIILNKIVINFKDAELAILIIGYFLSGYTFKLQLYLLILFT